jgi:hypothetical protein
MERSSEVRTAFENLLAEMSNGGEVWIDQMADTGDGAVLIGSGPSEWWVGPATRDAWITIVRAFRRTGLRVQPGSPEGFAEGSVGWAVDRPTFRSPNGSEMQARMTAIFRREAGAWKLVHAHNSIAVPDEEVEVFKDFAVSP